MLRSRRRREKSGVFRAAFKVDFLKNGCSNLIKLRTPYVAHVRDYRLDENEKNRMTPFWGVTIGGPNKLKKRLTDQATRKLTRTYDAALEIECTPAYVHRVNFLENGCLNSL